jgi:CheY-like chemotaxis protein
MAVVLVVEDEPTVMLLVDGIVAGSRHRTLTAANGGEALALMEREARIDLLFTDINLGDGPNGLDVATAARAKWPELKVVYASGQTLTDGMKALMVEGAVFLPKPYTPEQIEEAIGAAQGE